MKADRGLCIYPSDSAGSARDWGAHRWPICKVRRLRAKESPLSECVRSTTPAQEGRWVTVRWSVCEEEREEREEREDTHTHTHTQREREKREERREKREERREKREERREKRARYFLIVLSYPIQLTTTSRILQAFIEPDLQKAHIK